MEEKWIFGFYCYENCQINPASLRVFKTKSDAMHYIDLYMENARKHKVIPPLIFLYPARNMEF